MRPRWRVGVVLKLVTSGLLDDLVPLLVAVVVLLSVVMMIKKISTFKSTSTSALVPSSVTVS